MAAHGVMWSYVSCSRYTGGGQCVFRGAATDGPGRAADSGSGGRNPPEALHHSTGGRDGIRLPEGGGALQARYDVILRVKAGGKTGL